MINEAVIVTGDTVTATIDGKTYRVHASHPNFAAVIEAVKNRDYKAVAELADIPTAMAKISEGRVTVHEDKVLFDGEPLHNVLVPRLLRMFADGFDVRPMARFVENLMANPSRTAVEELYLFLEHNAIPITEDGCFLAYKRVQGDYTDIYSGTFDNSPGSVVEMPRNRVDDQRDNVCSRGLHFCALRYLGSYGSFGSGHRVVIVKINPADVVSIPSDYDNAKGRTCRYEVIGEAARDDVDVFDHAVETRERHGSYDWCTPDLDENCHHYG